jgi:hypothetical protein
VAAEIRQADAAATFRLLLLLLLPLEAESGE